MNEDNFLRMKKDFCKYIFYNIQTSVGVAWGDAALLQ